jgi:hypothetical protein
MSTVDEKMQVKDKRKLTKKSSLGDFESNKI